MIKLSKQANRLALCSILGVFIFVFILGSLDSWGIKNNKDFIDILKTALLFSLPLLGYWASIKLQNPEDVKDVNSLASTKDIKVRFYKTKGFVDRNDQISFVRFFLNNEFAYIYFCNYLKIYNGPIYIQKNVSTNSNHYYIKSISNYGNNEITIEINNDSILNTNFKFILKI